MTTVEHATINGAIPVAIFRPGTTTRDTLILHFQGGGFMWHFAPQNDALCARLAETCGCTVVSVIYRLAPAHPFPAAVDDAFAALQWAATQSDNIVVCGESAGGALAAATTLMAKARGGPSIAQQMLFYPMLAGGQDTPSRKAAEDDQPMGNIRAGWNAYTAGREDMTDPLAAPLFATDVAGLPPALVIVGEADPLVDEGVLYAEKLRDAGVPVELHRFADAPHGFLTSSKTEPLRAAALDLIRARL